MKKSNKIVLKVILTLVGLSVLFLGLFIFILVYESKSDISNQEPYASLLNVPQKIKVNSILLWSKNSQRFKNYSLVTNQDSHYNNENVKTAKHYKPGDYITFYAAKSYYNIHVSKTYYLLARDTLSSGEVIEFEYYFTPTDFPFN